MSVGFPFIFTCLSNSQFLEYASTSIPSPFAASRPKISTKEEDASVIPIRLPSGPVFSGRSPLGVVLRGV